MHRNPYVGESLQRPSLNPTAEQSGAVRIPRHARGLNRPPAMFVSRWRHCLHLWFHPTRILQAYG